MSLELFFLQAVVTVAKKMTYEIMLLNFMIIYFSIDIESKPGLIVARDQINFPNGRFFFTKGVIFPLSGKVYEKY